MLLKCFFYDFASHVKSSIQYLRTTSEQSLGNLDNKDYGSQVKMSDEFYELLKKNCGFTGKKATGDYPEKVNDGSRVLS